MYSRLGDIDISGHIYGDIKTDGGYIDVKQDGSVGVRTSARKGDAKGSYVSFHVCWATEAEASAFVAYCVANSPEASDFDEKAGVDIDLYLRSDDWHYRVWGVTVKAAPLGKEVMDYMQYGYEVVCYLYSPYSDAVAPGWSDVDTMLAGKADSTVTGQFGVAVTLIQYTAVVTGTAALMRLKSYGAGNVKVAIYADNAGEPGALLSAVDDSTAVVAGWNEIAIPPIAIASGTAYWIAFYSDDSLVDMAGTGAGHAALRYKYDTYATWTWPATAGSGYTSALYDGLVQIIGSGGISLDNSDGHMASAPDLEIVAGYSGGRAAALTAAIADSETLVLADQANSAETWELFGNLMKILQTYEDAVTAGTQWGRDWTGDGTFDTDHIELNNGESAYIRLSGPHQIKKPIKMTADLSLDSGGATGLAYVEISSDAVAWETVLTQADFAADSAEYVLQGSEYMTDCYVRIRCASGTSGKNVNIGSIKFEVERWIEDGAVPVVVAGATKTLTVSATGGAIAVTGTFTPRRKFL